MIDRLYNLILDERLLNPKQSGYHLGNPMT